MLVKELQIRAFRGIDSLDFEFQPGINVLIGVNGVGKSSILECLARCVFLYTEFILPTRYHQKIIFPTIECIKSGYEHMFVSLRAQINADEEGDWGLSLSRNYTLDGFLANTPDDLTRFGSPFLTDVQEKFKEAYLKNPAINVPLSIYYPTHRRTPQEDFSLRESDWFDRASNLTLNNQVIENQSIDFSDFFLWFREREDLENEQRLEQEPSYRDRQLEAVRQAIPQFLPGFSDLRVRRQRLRITVSKQGQELSINQLSDGEKSLLTMVADIARRLAIHHPSLDNPLQGTGVIMIDEIDAHLHPQWQRRIVPALQNAFPNCQFILATHSPLIISDLPPDNIYLLHQVDDRIAASHPEVSLGRDVNQILELVMDVPDRPARFKQDLQALFRLIDEGNLEEAKQLKTELEQLIGMDEPEFAKADVMIRRKEILGR
ncbi:AAA family ATPase [Alkalinema sp. FACHB-956]|uniref:AAA family ATPase n=1 Tax=Alkalinema sp. FACHB-956 TaxID=2692768 RepID=UPI00168978F3|nr:AAA family ATPase [Alkalinema sp. FACHB-956]MBD2326333.1 AAA family ATPase [Alkalinema sp. FACHB-956]